MPTYQCPKCGRTVEMPEGTYSCKVCNIQMRPVEAEATSLPIYSRLIPNSTSKRSVDELIKEQKQERINEITKRIEKAEFYCIESINALRHNNFSESRSRTVQAIKELENLLESGNY